MQIQKTVLRAITTGLLLSLLIPHALAQPAGDISGSITSVMLTMVYILIAVLNLFTWVLFFFLELFLDPEFIFGLDPVKGTDGPLLDMLHEIWILSRDLINVLFVFILIAGALITIIQAKSDKVKEYLPKFILAIVIVNFSWFIPRVVFDISQVLTATVFEIPGLLPKIPGVLPGGSDCKTKNLAGATVDCIIVKDWIFFEETKKITRGGTTAGDGILSTDGSTGWYCPLRPYVCVQLVTWKSKEAMSMSTRRRIINGLVVNHARLGTLATVMSMDSIFGAPSGIVGGATEILTALIRAALVLFIHIGLFFPIAAMVVAFFLRIPILWITMAFMPFAAVGYLLGDIGGKNTWDMIWKRFLSAVFLPAIVGIPLTVGFIMVNAGYSLDPTAPGAVAAGSTIKFPIIAGIDSLYQFIWLIMTFFIMYAGVFAAVKQDEFIGKFVSGIEGMGKTLGNIAYKAPLAVPFIPTPSGMSIGEVLAKPKNLDLDLSDGRLGGGANPEAQSMGDVVRNSSIKNDIQITMNAALDPGQTKNKIDEAITKLGTSDSRFNKNNVENAIQGIGLGIGMAQNEIDRIKRQYQAATPPAPVPPPTVPPGP